MPTIPALIDRAAAWFGDATAVEFADQTLSFRDVGERSSRLANALIALSPESRGRVAILSPNCLEWVEIDFAIAKAGKVRVPINTRLADEEREYVLADSGAETLIFAPQFASFVESVRDRLPALRNVIALGDADTDGMRYETVLGAAVAATPCLDHPLHAPNFILYTSGTTGRPKGATATNLSRLTATQNMLAEEIEAVPGDAMVHAGSMAHGSGSKILAYFVRGARNIPMAKFDPEAFLALVEEKHATATFLVPTMIAMLLEAAQGSNADVGSLKTISYGGAPITADRLREALERFGNVFVQVYGSSEAPHPVLVLRKQDHIVTAEAAQRLESLGREVAMAEVRIVDGDDLDVEAGERGEMLIRGDNVMAGYWGNDAATSEVLRDGWYHTGDVVRRNEHGFYYMVDRVRDMIISGGLNVYPAEVEAALRRHPAVKEAAAVGVPDERWGESVKAFVVLHDGAAATEGEILGEAQHHLAGYKKPRSLAIVGALPKGATGKILKRDLRDPHWQSLGRQVN